MPFLIPGPNNELITGSLPDTASRYTPYFPALTTDAPTTSTASIWKLGTIGTGSVTIVSSSFITIEIDGQLFKLVRAT